MQLLHAEVVQCSTHTDDVDDSVVTTEFVQVHVLRRYAVQAPLDHGQRSQRRDGGVGHRLRARAPSEGDKVRRPALGEGVGDLDMHPGGLQAVVGDALGADRPAGQTRAVDGRADCLERTPGVNQCRKEHVTGEAGKRVDDRDHRRAPMPARRCAAIAALKPESMFTTATPAAQLVNIASNAVTPSKAAP